MRSALGASEFETVTSATSRKPLASTYGATIKMPANAPMTTSGIKYGRSGVRRMETTRREAMNVRAASAELYAAFGIRVKSNSVIAWGKTRAGIST